MPSVAVCVCQECGCTDEVIVHRENMLTTMPSCKCGGRMQVSRVFYDRRMSDEPTPLTRRTDDACFDPEEPPAGTS